MSKALPSAIWFKCHMISMHHFQHLSSWKYWPEETRGCFHPALCSNRQQASPRCRHKCSRDKPVFAAGCPPRSLVCYPEDLWKTWVKTMLVNHLADPLVAAGMGKTSNTHCVPAQHREKWYCLWAPSVRTPSSTDHLTGVWDNSRGRPGHTTAKALRAKLWICSGVMCVLKKACTAQQTLRQVSEKHTGVSHISTVNKTSPRNQTI